VRDVDEDRWLTTKEAAAYTGYTTDTISAAAAGGDLEGYRSGPIKGHWRFQRAALDSWMRRGNRKPRRANRAPARLRAERYQRAC